MKNKAALVLALGSLLLAANSEPWRLAMPGYRYEFPRDNFNHPEFQTEWWYYTGNLHTADGHRFGFELTFFRQGVDREPKPSAVWDVRDVWFAHFAVSDLDGGRFFYTERINRAGVGIAGAGIPTPSHDRNGAIDNSIPSRDRKGAVANSIPSRDRKEAVAHPIPSRDRKEAVAHPIPSRDRKGAVAHPIPSRDRKEAVANSKPNYPAASDQSRIWNGNWQVTWHGASQRLQAIAEQFSIELSLDSQKPPVIHGIDGISQKAPGPGHASHYISLTRLLTRGTIAIEGKSFSADGLAWMDHEFFTHQLEPEQSGWDWFSMQFDDGTELMLFRLRRKDGSADPYSSGTYVDRQGRATHITHSEFSLTPGKLWKRYPIEWTIQVPTLGIHVNLKTPLPQQELASKIPGVPSYWEGAIEITGTRTGAGYLEMTGYE